MLNLLLLGISLCGAASISAADFYAYWGDGKAELSSYRVVQPRYGELREGYGVMIFVTEDIHPQTYIKLDAPRANPDRLYALKLNHVLKFATGLYDYSVMTSVFSQVEGGAHPFDLRKISLSAQEWCGHVFDEVLFRGDEAEGRLNSYFEGEGRRDYEFDLPEVFESEDHLLVRIRELQRPFMAEGATRKMALLPSLWHFRQVHRPHQLVPGEIAKGGVAAVEIGGELHTAVPWTLEIGARTRTLWTERAYPHRILRWEDSDGGRGELRRTIRVPYWELQGNRDAFYRRELGIPN